MNLTTFKLPDMFTSSGNLTMLEGSDGVSQNLRLMTETSKEELLGMPDFGTNIESYRMEQNVSIIEDMVREDIIQNVLKYDQRVKINSNDIKVTRIEDKVYLNSSYYLINRASTFTTTVLISSRD